LICLIGLGFRFATIGFGLATMTKIVTSGYPLLDEMIRRNIPLTRENYIADSNRRSASSVADCRGLLAVELAWHTRKWPCAWAGPQVQLQSATARPLIITHHHGPGVQA
jgi:hypothetical protein